MTYEQWYSLPRLVDELNGFVLVLVASVTRSKWLVIGPTETHQHWRGTHECMPETNVVRTHAHIIS